MVLIFKASICWLLIIPASTSATFISTYQPYTPPTKRQRNTQSHSSDSGDKTVWWRQPTTYLSATTNEAPNPNKNNNNNIGEINEDELYMERFRRRLQETRLRQAARIELLPPNPAFVDPCEFVTAILNELRGQQQQQQQYQDADEKKGGRNNNENGNDLGLRVLLRASTPEWRNVMHRSVGAPLDTDEDSVIAVLRSSLGRSNNQFNILLGKTTKDVLKDGDVNDGESSSSSSPDVFEYTISFPNDAVDYDDGMCWIECRLRCATNDDLLVAMGWTLQKRKEDGAWLIHSIDWQDFRDQFRPGIGREEWERICG